MSVNYYYFSVILAFASCIKVCMGDRNQNISINMLKIPKNKAAYQPETKQQSSLNKARNKIIGEKIRSLNLSTDAKLKRLKDLRTEVRLLAHQIKMEQMNSEIQSGSPQWRLKKNTRSYRRWRRRIFKKIQILLSRVRKIERQVKAQSRTLRRLRKSNQMTLASTISVGPTIPKGQKQLGKDSRHNKRKKLPAKSKSLLQQTDQQTNLSDRYAGESECQSHKDCKQGHCCHRASFYRRGNCVRYNLKEAAPCKHSCACESKHLQCQLSEIGNEKENKSTCQKAHTSTETAFHNSSSDPTIYTYDSI